MSDWDAARYHRVSDPQHSWGLRVVDRLRPLTGETVLDIGCGTGRLTSVILDRAPAVGLFAIDRSWAMVSAARGHLPSRVGIAQADAIALPLPAMFDAVFSTATFHWVRDHPALFSEILRVLRPGGRLVSQAGGGPNLARLYRRSEAIVRAPAFARYFADWVAPWNFAGVDDTIARLEEAGFVDVQVWLEEAPTPFTDARMFEDFIATVCLRHQVNALPSSARQAYVHRIVGLAAVDDPPFTLDYWRLNIDARKP